MSALREFIRRMFQNPAGKLRYVASGLFVLFLVLGFLFGFLASFAANAVFGFEFTDLLAGLLSGILAGAAYGFLGYLLGLGLHLSLDMFDLFRRKTEAIEKIAVCMDIKTEMSVSE